MSAQRVASWLASTDAWRLRAGAIGIAALSGLAVTLLASQFGDRSAYYLAIAGLAGIGVFVAATRAEPLRFVFLALVGALPIAGALVPPGRFGVTAFDAVMLALTIALVGRSLASGATPQPPLFPTRSLMLAWLLCIPCVALSHFPLLSLAVGVAMFALHTFFWFTLEELRRDRGIERLVVLLSGVLLVMALGVFVDYALRTNLSLRGANLNQLTYFSGMEIYRAAGFFQDPQKAAAFLATLITFLLVLTIRGRFGTARMRFIVWLAILLGLAALPVTISRGAILASLFVSAMALFAFNSWGAHVKVIVVASAGVALLLVAQTPPDLWLDVLPAAFRERFLHAGEELENRLIIWFDTWDMFSEQPLTGIGPGSFRDYLLETRPGVYNYYGIGANLGVPYIPDQPENGYLKIFYEGGLLGSLAALIVTGDAVRRAFAVIADSGAPSEARTECIAALAGLMTFGLTFLTLFTVTDPRLGALFAFLLAVIWHRSLERSHSARHRV